MMTGNRVSQKRSYNDKRKTWSLSIILLIFVLSTPLLLWQHSAKAQLESWQNNGIALPKSVSDQGTFDDLNQRAKVNIPTWLNTQLLSLRTWEILDQDVNGEKPQKLKKSLLGLFYQEQLLSVFAFEQGQLKANDQRRLKQSIPKLDLSNIEVLDRRYPKRFDRDKDGIFDQLDIHLGAVKTALNGAEYQEGYERLTYPMGDVSRTIGVCTDVVVRAFRNAGWDLQEILYKDMKARPKAYGLKDKKPNRHIDHRRVRRLIVYFKKHYKALPIKFDPKQSGDEAWLPGDLVFMDTLNKGRPTHVALVSGILGPDGEPLMINNWTYGYKTSAMSLKYSADYLYRFRLGLKK